MLLAESKCIAGSSFPDDPRTAGASSRPKEMFAEWEI